MGDFVVGKEHYDRALAIYDPAEQRPLPTDYISLLSTVGWRSGGYGPKRVAFFGQAWSLVHTCRKLKWPINVILVRVCDGVARRHHRSPATRPTAGGADPRSAACARQGPNSHALFAAEIQYFVRENMALSAVSSRCEQLLVAEPPSSAHAYSKGLALDRPV
jgi:hypothetical protein